MSADTGIARWTALEESDWRDRQRRHRERIEPWIAPRMARRGVGATHAVDDFLFDYYPYSPAKLRAWHPGAGTLLLGDAREFLAWPAYVELDDGIAACRPLGGAAARRVRLVRRLLESTGSRPAQLGCFGLHEWAMVHGQDQDEVRHAALPLRLSPAAIAATVADLGLRCTHIDAYRFFTQTAVPLNAYVPTRDTQHELEQPGCLHANMDLYKYAMWFSPYVGSELVADCFALARMARELDMRAAPYDLSDLGYAPIRIETPAGRRTYAEQQRELGVAAIPLRAALLEALTTLVEWPGVGAPAAESTATTGRSPVGQPSTAASSASRAGTSEYQAQ
ncbi:MAG: 3-methyladenine DNA glycosylase [Actinomycetota bacterium]|nr:3-methyladenine DNA glycosylase [Actinomycetota bacterium]